jgi:cytochrome c2
LTSIIVLLSFRKPALDTDFDFCGTESVNTFSLYSDFQKGEALFDNNCASCHFADKDMTGPALKGARERGTEYAYEDWIYDKRVYGKRQNGD